MGVVALDHINIATPKLEETRAFYCEVLGFKEGYRPGFATPGHWLYVGDKPIVHLQVAGIDHGDGGAVRHFAFEVEDLDGLVARLEQSGTLYRRTQTPDGVFEQIFFTDPSGAHVELSQRA